MDEDKELDEQEQEKQKEEPTTQSKNEKEIDLAKKEWGEDDNTVYYTIDTKSNDTYTISVRSKSTTEQLAEYEVDVKEQTAVIK